MEGKFERACEQWRGVDEADEACLPARRNLSLVRAELTFAAAVAGEVIKGFHVAHEACRMHTGLGTASGGSEGTFVLLSKDIILIHGRGT